MRSPKRAVSIGISDSSVRSPLSSLQVGRGAETLTRDFSPRQNAREAFFENLREDLLSS